MNRFIICVLLSAFTTYASAITYSDCGSTSGEVTTVEVSDCPDGQGVCPLKKNTDVQITIKFNSKADTKSLKAVVTGYIHRIPIPFSIPQNDGCKSGVSCPVKYGQSYVYQNKLHIRNFYPSLSVTVMYELKDENGADMACVKIPCKIQ